MHDGISTTVREICYKRDSYTCTNPKCYFKDQVEELPNGEKRWKNKYWSEVVNAWVQNKLHLHHCIWRSRYAGDDRHEPWNLTLLCEGCHDLLHNPPVMCVAWSKEIEQWCIDLAISRRLELGKGPLSQSRDDSRFEKRKYMRKEQRTKHDKDQKKKYRDKYEHDKKIFMENNQGLTPVQVQYRRKKALKDKENSASVDA